jgi:hypothetical protein
VVTRLACCAFALVGAAACAEDAYIQSDGTSGMNTGYRMTARSRLEVDFALTETGYSLRLFGTSAYEPTFQTWFGTSGGGHFVFGASNAVQRVITYPPSGNPQMESVCDLNRHTAIFQFGSGTFDFRFVTGSATNTLVGVFEGLSGLEASMPLPLFGQYGNGAATKFVNGAKLKIYGVKIYEDDVLVRNFVPCRREGTVACFKDTCTGSFIVGENVAAFTAGGDVQNLPDAGYVSTAANATGGKLYIDTGYTTTEKSAVALDCALAVNPDLYNGLVWRLFEEGAAKICGFDIYGDASHVQQLRYRYVGTYGHEFTTAFAGAIANGKEVRRTFFLDNSGTAAVVTSSQTNQVVVFSPEASVSHSYPLKIAANWAGNGDWAALKIYGCKIWEDGVLVRDFVPYVDNGVPGLRDRLTGQFKSASRDSSDTTSSLAYGGEIAGEQDAYIESTGTTGINTGYKLKGNSRLEVDFALTASPQTTKRLIGTSAYEPTFQTWFGTSGGGHFLFGASNAVQRVITYPPNGNPQTESLCDLNRHTAIVQFGSGTFDFRFVTGSATNTLAGVFAGTSGLEASMPLPVFAEYADAAGTTYAKGIKARIYSLRIYERGADGERLVREFLPYEGGSAEDGFYDTVTGVRIHNGLSFTYHGAGHDHGNLSVIVRASGTRVNSSGAVTLTAFAPGATSYRWTKNGESVAGGADGTFTAAWTKSNRTDVYRAVAVYDDFYGVARESEPSAELPVYSVPNGTLLVIR